MKLFNFIIGKLLIDVAVRSLKEAERKAQELAKEIEELKKVK